jgi:hypothetical protein
MCTVWGSAPRIPADAQTVHILVTSSEVRLDPAVVQAGEVYFVVEAPAQEHADFAFVNAGYGSQGGPPLPLSDDAVDRLARGDYQGTSLEFGWAGYAKFTLLEGNYAFMTGGGEPGTPPQSLTVLEVQP